MSKNIKLGTTTYLGIDTIQVPDVTEGIVDSFVDTTDANAVANDIVTGKTAYVNGTKVTGTANFSSYSITTNITNGTYSGATIIYPDAPGVTIEAVVTLTPSTGYELIDVNVTNATYTINWETREVTLTHATNNVVITADVRQASVGLEFEQVNQPASNSLQTTNIAGATNDTYVVKSRGTCMDTDIVIPSTYNGGKVIGIKAYAFFHKTDITSIAIPYNIESIGVDAFASCTSLTSITILNSVTSIGGSAFDGCRSLTSITIPNSVTSIGGGAFNGCSSLTSIIILNGVTSIEREAFHNCSSLTSIEIPNSVTYMGFNAFGGCSLGTFIVHYNGYLIDIYDDVTYQQNVLYGIYTSNENQVVTFIDLNDDSQDILISDLIGGSGSGSGSGSGNGNN